jgi:hypothetical protein
MLTAFKNRRSNKNKTLCEWKMSAIFLFSRHLKKETNIGGARQKRQCRYPNERPYKWIRVEAKRTVVSYRAIEMSRLANAQTNHCDANMKELNSQVSKIRICYPTWWPYPTKSNFPGKQHSGKLAAIKMPLSRSHWNPLLWMTIEISLSWGC